MRITDFTDYTAAEAFALAEKLCAHGYAVQGGPAPDCDLREIQQQVREERGASPFEELYCTIRDIADDWHRESVRRRDGKEPGQFSEDDLTPGGAIESAMQVVLHSTKDMDY